jgi:PEGA domain-containing protein
MFRRLVTIAALLATPARAQTTAAVLGLETHDAPADLVQEMTLALRIGMTDAPGYRAVPGKDLVEIRLIFCSGEENPACLAQAARSLGAQQILYGVIARGSKGFTVSLKLLDAPSATVKATAQETLPMAVTTQDVQGAATRLLGRLVGLPVPASLRVLCEPAGAQLFLDDREIGYVGEGGRVVQDVAAGPRKVRLTLEGYAPFEGTVDIKGGEQNDLRVQLTLEAQVRVARTAPPPAPPPSPHATRAWRIVSWVSLGIAAAAGSAAVVTGMKTRSLQDDKDRAIVASRAGIPSTDPGYINAGPGGDACAEAAREGNGSVSDLCDRGERMALVTNVLLSTAGAAALVWGVSFDLGYLRVEPGPSGATLVGQVRF